MTAEAETGAESLRAEPGLLRADFESHVREIETAVMTSRDVLYIQFYEYNRLSNR